MQNNYVRTTVTLPHKLLLEVKHYALNNQTNVSRLIEHSLRKTIQTPKAKKKHSILSLAGDLNLKNIKILPRYKLYEDHVKHKMGL